MNQHKKKSSETSSAGFPGPIRITSRHDGVPCDLSPSQAVLQIIDDIAINPEHYSLWQELACIADIAGLDAIACITIALSNSPQSKAGHAVRGQCLCEKGTRNAQAESDLRVSLGSASRFANEKSAKLITEIFVRRGDVSGAIQLIDEVIASGVPGDFAALKTSLVKALGDFRVQRERQESKG